MITDKLLRLSEKQPLFFDLLRKKAWIAYSAMYIENSKNPSIEEQQSFDFVIRWMEREGIIKKNGTIRADVRTLFEMILVAK